MPSSRQQRLRASHGRRSCASASHRPSRADATNLRRGLPCSCGIGDRCRWDVSSVGEEHAIPVLRLNKPDRSRWDDRKLDHVRPYLERATEPGVVAIVAAQEFQYVFTGTNRATKPGAVNFAFEKSQRRVTTYYFYVLDAQFGPGFIKICSYFPYPAKVWVNGHEWAKCQARKAGVPFCELANGF